MRSLYRVTETYVVAALVLTAIACRKHQASPPLDAPPRDAAIAAIDAAVAVIDAAVKPAPTVTRLAAAGDATCAVMSDLTLRCWGGNAHGQLGNGLTVDSATPITPAIRAVTDLQLADGTACALLDDTSVACWGRIGWHGHAEDILRPTGVLGVIGVKQIFVLTGRACARVANDSLVCWGNVDARGHFATGPTNRAPTPVVGLDHVAGLRADGAFSDDGRMWIWARDGAPKLVAVSGVQELGGRDGAVCGRLATGRVMCAGTTRCGERRPPTPPPPPKPAATTKPGRPGRPATKPSKTAKAKTSAKPAGSDKLTKPPPAGSPASPPPGEPIGEPADLLGFTAVRQLAFDLGYCVVTTASRLQCGDGCRQVDPPRLERVETMVGRCAQLRSGTVSCFDDAKATAIPGLTGASHLAAGRAHACAVSDGRIRCWGNNDHSQLGDYSIGR